MAKITKNFLFEVLVVFTLSSASLSHECSNNCAECISSNSCYICYKRFAVDNGPNSACSATVQPASNHCILYDDSGCFLCEPGWAQDEQNQASCARGTIAGCVQELIFTGRHICRACLNGYPSSDLSGCIPASQVKTPIPQCVVGSSYSVGVNGCEKCQPGYTSDGKTCFKTPPSLEGCLYANPGRNLCLTCDFENGYFERDPKKCAKNDSTLA